MEDNIKAFEKKLAEALRQFGNVKLEVASKSRTDSRDIKVFVLLRSYRPLIGLDYVVPDVTVLPQNRSDAVAETVAHIKRLIKSHDATRPSRKYIDYP